MKRIALASAMVLFEPGWFGTAVKTHCEPATTPTSAAQTTTPTGAPAASAPPPQTV